MGNVYKDARDKLSPAQRDQMDNEYQSMKSKGKLMFTSKLTGLDYTIPGNVKAKTAPAKPVSDVQDFMDKVMGKSKPSKQMDFTPPKGMEYPSATKITAPDKYVPEIAQDNTTLVSKTKDRILSDPEKGVIAFDAGKSPAVKSDMEKLRTNVDKEPSIKATDPTLSNEAGDYIIRNAKHKEQQQSMFNKFLNGTDKPKDAGLIPESLQALTQKMALNSYKRDDNTYGPESKAILYKVAENAQKRTGKLSTGTMYKDYKGVVPDDVYSEIEKLNKMNVSPKAIVNTQSSKGYNLATSMGRFSVAGDGKGNQILTDSYDFKNEDTNKKNGDVNENLFAGNTSVFAQFRKFLAKRDGNLSAKELDKLQTSISLTPKDTVGFGNRPKGKISWK